MSLARRILAVSLVAVLAIAPSTSAQRDLPELPDYPLIIGDPASYWQISPGAENPDAFELGASWTVTATPIDGNTIDLRVRVVAPAVTLPVASGPAVLYTAVALGGGFGGDVGYSRLVSVEPTPLPACAGDPCVFETTVSAGFRRLPRIARRVRRLETVWAGVGFTLVRTFGRGSWLQVQGSERPNDTMFSGTLGEPAPWVGNSAASGLFPARGASARWRDGRDRTAEVERLTGAWRDAADDTSTPPTTTDVRLVATFVGCPDSDDDRNGLAASLRTAAGDQVTIRRAKGRDFVDAVVPIPRDTSWRVGWESDPTTAFDVAEHPLLVTAVYRCRMDDGPEVTDVAVAEVVMSPGVPGASASPDP